jgi:hypothetical protein
VETQGLLNIAAGSHILIRKKGGFLIVFGGDFNSI